MFECWYKRDRLCVKHGNLQCQADKLNKLAKCISCDSGNKGCKYREWRQLQLTKRFKNGQQGGYWKCRKCMMRILNTQHPWRSISQEDHYWYNLTLYKWCYAVSFVVSTTWVQSNLSLTWSEESTLNFLEKHLQAWLSEKFMWIIASGFLLKKLEQCIGV